LLARVLGLAQVDVQPAGQGGKVALQYLGHRDAQAVREQILLAVSIRAKRDLADTAPETATTDPRAQGVAGPLDERLRDLADVAIAAAALEAGTVVKVPLGRLIASILLGSEMLTLVIIAAGIVIMSVLVSPAILATGLPLALVFIGVVIGQFNRGFNFVLSRAADGVRVGAGLTATTTETIPFGRIHAVEAQQPLGWRPFGWWKVRITTAGHSLSQGGQNRLQNMVLPVGQLDDVLRVFETLLHEGETGSAEREAALAQALTGPGDGFLKSGPRAGWLLWCATRRTGLRIELAELSPHTQQSSLRIRRGWFTRSLSVMPMVRAQSVQLSRPMVHRLLGLASLQVHTVLGPVRMQMRGFALADAREAFTLLATTIVRVQQQDAAERLHALRPSTPTPDRLADEQHGGSL
ncbi:MAG: PH domain-containing protein, partial [Microbacteriaceae bacterium]|nr:PH domain-containing protein [Microbacteriaceae bacterium]